MPFSILSPPGKEGRSNITISSAKMAPIQKDTEAAISTDLCSGTKISKPKVIRDPTKATTRAIKDLTKATKAPIKVKAHINQFTA